MRRVVRTWVLVGAAVLIAAAGIGCNERKEEASQETSQTESAVEQGTAAQGSTDQTQGTEPGGVPPAGEAKPTDEPKVTSEASESAQPTATRVRLETTKGDIVIELNEAAAPVTCANFLRYVKEGFYDGTIFHRVIKDFMIQGGGFTASMQQKATHEPIVNESSNGLKNVRGAIAMARTRDLNSATSQFFINHRDNPNLNHGGPFGGYAVFGRVVEGMDVVDAIAAVATTTVGRYQNVPVQPVVIERASVLEKP